MYFHAFLKEEAGKTYNEFVLDLFNEELSKEEAEKLKNETSTLKKGLNWFFFGDTNPT